MWVSIDPGLKSLYVDEWILETILGLMGFREVSERKKLSRMSPKMHWRTIKPMSKTSWEKHFSNAGKLASFMSLMRVESPREI